MGFNQQKNKIVTNYKTAQKHQDILEQYKNEYDKIFKDKSSFKSTKILKEWKLSWNSEAEELNWYDTDSSEYQALTNDEQESLAVLLDNQISESAYPNIPLYLQSWVCLLQKSYLPCTLHFADNILT